MKRGSYVNWILAVLLVLVSFTLAGAQPGGGSPPPHLEYIGTLHQLRLGESDASGDFVVPKNYGGQPLCLTKGGDLKITWIDETPGVQWKVVAAKLTSNVDATIHWTLSGESGFMSPGYAYDLPGDMPTYIDWCKLEITIVASAGTQGEGGGGPPPPIVVGSDDVFVVLDAPQSPPNDTAVVGWVNVLKWATSAANHASDAHTAKLLANWKMYDTFTYDTSKTWWTETTGSQDVFWIRMFFAEKKGQCNDFADGLSVAYGQLGVSGTAPHRSYPNNGSTLSIRTDPIDPAGGAMSIGPYSFWYHQFVMASSTTWDAALMVESGGNFVRVTDYAPAQYESDLVSYYWYDYNSNRFLDQGEPVSYPGSGSPFSPTLVTVVGTAASKNPP